MDNTANDLIFYEGDLIAGGSFQNAGGNLVNFIARWNGNSWRDLDGGMNGTVDALESFGGELFAGGIFTNAGGKPISFIARWNGLEWEELTAGFNRSVHELDIFAHGLVAWGAYDIAGGDIAHWHDPNPEYGCFVRGDLTCDGFVDRQDVIAFASYFTTGTLDLVCCEKASDIDRDGNILTVSDYAKLTQYILGTSFIFGNFPNCECEYQEENCVFDCDPDFVLSFPDQGGTWPQNTDQVVSWYPLKIDVDDIESYDIYIMDTNMTIIELAHDIPNNIFSKTLYSLILPTGYYYVRVDANMENGEIRPELSNKQIYVPSYREPKGFSNTHWNEYLYMDPMSCDPDIKFTGTNYHASTIQKHKDIDMTVSPDGDYIFTPRVLAPSYSNRLERIDLTVPGYPVDVIMYNAPIRGGIDPVAIPGTDLMLYAVDEVYRVFDLDMLAPHNISATGLVDIEQEGYYDIDPTISNDGRRAIRPGDYGFDVIDLRNPYEISVANVAIQTGIESGIDVVITPDNNTAIYVKLDGYHLIDITDPDTPHYVDSILGRPTGGLWGGSNVDIDIALTNGGTRFIYPTSNPPGYDLVDLSFRNDPELVHVPGQPMIHTAIDLTLTHDGRYAFYPAENGYDRIDMRTGDLVNIASNPYAFEGIDIVITPDDKYALYPAYHIIVTSEWEAKLLEGYDIIDVENATLARFVSGRPALQAHRDIQITPDGTRALYPRGTAEKVSGYDLIDIDNAAQTEAIEILIENVDLYPEPDLDLVISSTGEYAIHAGRFTNIDGGTGYVSIKLTDPYEAIAPVDSLLVRAAINDPVMNLTSTMAEDIDQDYYFVTGFVLVPPPDTGYVDSIKIVPIDMPPINVPVNPDPGGPIWLPHPEWDLDTAFAQMRFQLNNDDPDVEAFTFSASFLQYFEDTAVYYPVSEDYIYELDPGDSVIMDCSPPLPESISMGLTYLVVEWFEGYDATGVANNILARSFMLYTCGDANCDCKVNVSDAVYVINFVFSGGTAPAPYVSGDANCDEKVNVSDAVVIINYVFSQGYTPGDPNDDGIPDC